MKTGLRTTYILLEKGVEDEQLREEIQRVISLVGGGGLREIAKKYPKLLELKQALDGECEKDECDATESDTY